MTAETEQTTAAGRDPTGIQKTHTSGSISLSFNMRGFIALACVVAVVFAAEKKKDEKKEDYGTVVGIDLGTTYSV